MDSQLPGIHRGGRRPAVASCLGSDLRTGSRRPTGPGESKRIPQGIAQRRSQGSDRGNHVGGQEIVSARIMSLAGRLFLTQPWVQTGAVSVAAVVLSWSLWALAPFAHTTLERRWYDAWLQTRQPPAPSPSVLV